jgi:RimJ/RimL family protein N-acetyltransferase
MRLTGSIPVERSGPDGRISGRAQSWFDLNRAAVLSYVSPRRTIGAIGLILPLAVSIGALVCVPGDTGPMALDLPGPPLADEVVAIRRWRPADVPANVMGFADPVVQRHSWPHTRPYTEADARAFYAEQQRERRAGTALSVALVEPGAPTTVLGGASLYAIDLAAARAAVGYWLVPAARGRGVATHSVRLLATWAFGHLATQRLELTCAPDNLASQRVAVRCGFTREAVLRSHTPFKGGRRDTVLFSLLPGELR